MKQILIRNCNDCPHAKIDKVCGIGVKIIKSKWPQIPVKCTLLDADFEKDVSLSLDRLFWLVTQISGVARYGPDVTHFSNMVRKFKPEDTAYFDKLIKDYNKPK